MDTRKDRGDFYPGGETGGSAPAPQQSDKVDRVNLGEVGESYTLKDVKQKVNQIVRVIAPAAVGLMLIIAGAIGIGAANFSPRMLLAATAPLEDIHNTSPVVTNEEDAVALATLATATNALQASTEAAMSELRSDIQTATNNLTAAFNGALAAESNRVESTYAKRSEIPTAPDLAPYALKSELPTDYLKEGDITNFATRAWISAQGYATEAGTDARLEAQDLAIGAATNAQNAAIAATSNALATAHAADMAKVGAATNALKAAMSELSSDTMNRINALELNGGNTRLWTSDATRFQDATGVVWQVQVVTGNWSVVHSWTTNGVDFGWTGPYWWGPAEGVDNDYYEGPGWYVESGNLTPWRRSEDQYAAQIVVEWEYYGEEAHAVTTTCSRTVQWLTNAVNRVAYTNDLEAGIPKMWPLNAVTNADGTAVTAYNFDGLNLDGIGATASDAWQMATDALGGLSGVARAATNYTEAVASEFVDGTREVATAYSAMVADNAGNASFAEEAELAQYLLGGFDKTERWEVEDLILASTNAAIAVSARKQDALPYPTNAIPFSAIDGAPTSPSVFYDAAGGAATVSGATLTYQAASNSVGSVALLAGTNVLHITAPSAITGHVRDFGLTVSTEDAATITLDSSVSWRFDAANTNLAAGSWNRVYCTESPTGVFSLQLWTPDSAQEATP